MYEGPAAVQQYTVSVQRELARDTTLEMHYVGNRALRLLIESTSTLRVN
jgi:hypothetical protein